MRVPATLAATAATTLLVSVLVTQAGATMPEAPVKVSIGPDRVQLTAGRPCLPTTLDLGMTNTGDTPVYADSFLRADRPLTVSRRMFSSYLPAQTTVTVPAILHAPYDTEPGEYDVTLKLAHDGDGPPARVPVEVTAAPEKTPGTNLLLGEQVTASSTYLSSSASYAMCGGVDGDRTWSHDTAWASGVSGNFPDTYTVTLPRPELMTRVELYTYTRDSLRDWDVLVMVSDEWRTVAQVRGNTLLHVTSSFPAVEATAVRIIGLGANDNGLTRISELEAYGDPPPGS